MKARRNKESWWWTILETTCTCTMLIMTTSLFTLLGYQAMWSWSP